MLLGLARTSGAKGCSVELQRETIHEDWYMKKLLTVEELGRMLEVSKATVYRWVHCEFVPYLKVGGAVRFDEEGIQKWLKARASAGRARMPVDLD